MSHERLCTSRLVFLDSAGKFSRLADAERVRRWVESGSVVAADARRISS